MIWSEELLKEIQRQENRIVVGACAKTIEDAAYEMEALTHKYLKQTRPVSKPAEVNFIGRKTYDARGQLIDFYLEPLVKFRYGT
jgi:hypothetical protein